MNRCPCNRYSPVFMGGLFLMALMPSLGLADRPSEAVSVDVKKIWDQGAHNAFTDLVRHQDRWYCVFREGQAHVSPDGAVRVLVSSDGADWESAALLGSPRGDVRDPKIVVTPKGQLMVVAAIAIPDGDQKIHQSVVAFSDDGRTWSDWHDVGDENFWLWRVIWHGDTAYGIGYQTRPEKSTRLYRSADGKQFDTLVETLFGEGYPNETGIVVGPDETMHCLMRRDGEKSSGQLGTSKPPYTEWTWRDTGTRIGGPQLLRLPDGRLVAAVRLYDGGARTSLCWVDPANAKITEFQVLPSGGDTSYPGLVFHDGKLWVSYYASHEGKTNIYLAKVVLPAAK
ncbi:MAG: exo-alpha-sialidase [Pirellulales bacterium]|nr:exo-alpha-sialidase [Pirellulales bacterium]